MMNGGLENSMNCNIVYKNYYDLVSNYFINMDAKYITIPSICESNIFKHYYDNIISINENSCLNIDNKINAMNKVVENNFYNETTSVWYCGKTYFSENNINKEEIKLGYDFFGYEDVIYDAQTVSAVNDILNILQVEDVKLRIKTINNEVYNSNLSSCLIESEIDFELTEDLENNLYYSDLYFEFIDDKNNVIARGGKYNLSDITSEEENKKAIGFELNFQNIIENINEKDIISENIDFIVVAKTDEEKLHSFKVINNLRDYGFRTKLIIDDEVCQSNYKIELKEEELNKGLISLTDNLLSETQVIDEYELIEYINMNL